MFTQLTLDLQLKQSFTFDNFIIGDNQLLIELIKTMNDTVEKQVFVWGEHNTGKTHLLQAVSHYLSTQNFQVSYLPLSQLQTYSPELLIGQEMMDLCCIDDVHLLKSLPDWQEALFDLINRIRESNSRLIVSGSHPPAELQLALKDLVSRLQWGPVFRLQSLNDENKRLALVQRAESRGFELADNVASYLLNNHHRDIAELFNMLEALDKAQLQQHRRLTIPFVKSVLEA